jgi:hypothetical protein
VEAAGAAAPASSRLLVPMSQYLVDERSSEVSSSSARMPRPRGSHRRSHSTRGATCSPTPTCASRVRSRESVHPGCLKLADGDAEMLGEMDAAKQRRRLLGLLLIEMGLISEEQLEEALKAQKRTGELLGEVLVGRGYVTRLAIQDALASQRGVLLEADPGFGGGLRDELVRRESRREPSADHRPLESEKIAAHAPEKPELSIAGRHPEPRVGQRSETQMESESDLERELRRLGAVVGKNEQRLAELELELEQTRRALAEALRGMPPAIVPAVRLQTSDSRAADNFSEPFLVTVGRARKYLAARRAALRQRSPVGVQP